MSRLCMAPVILLLFVFHGYGEQEDTQTKRVTTVTPIPIEEAKDAKSMFPDDLSKEVFLRKTMEDYKEVRGLAVKAVSIHRTMEQSTGTAVMDVLRSTGTVASVQTTTPAPTTPGQIPGRLYPVVTIEPPSLSTSPVKGTGLIIDKIIDYEDLSWIEKLKLKVKSLFSIKNIVPAGGGGGVRGAIQNKKVLRMDEVYKWIRVPIELRGWTVASIDSSVPPSVVARPGIMPDDLENAYAQFLNFTKDQNLFQSWMKRLNFSVNISLNELRSLYDEVATELAQQRLWADAVAQATAPNYLDIFADALGSAIIYANWNGRMSPSAHQYRMASSTSRRKIKGSLTQIFDGARW